MKKLSWIFYLIILFVAGTACKQDTYDVIIRHAQLANGTGGDLVKADVGLRGDTIAAIGNLSNAKADTIVQAADLVLAPGFIDTHSHHDWGILKMRGVEAAVSQGITTIVVGQDGGSKTPIEKFFKALTDTPVAVNLASYSGHNSIREMVMGDDFKRLATTDQVSQMKMLLEADLKAGALGLSTGLEYDPGIYSSNDEVIELAKTLVPYQGRYISHLRSEDRYFDKAVNEIIEIGKLTGVPVQISHFKLAMKGLWGKSMQTLAKLNEARNAGIKITADVYPYPYWSSTVRVLFPDRNFTDEKEAAFILREVTSPEGILFSSYTPKPEFEGKTLAAVAANAGISPEKMLIQIIRWLDECEKINGDCSGGIVATSMDEGDIQKLLQWEYSGVCSDGASRGRHPRGYGAFTRILKKYVREDSVLTLENAVRKMTGLNAEQLGINRRGFIREGYYADLVLFNPKEVSDQSTTENPQMPSSGIEGVWVNGKLVYQNKRTTGIYPGRVIRRNDF
ncbi:MAG: D-aminoacylase [Bacteroidetes bacterium]|nr:D-aminoacylase [Bacteroidota bacterium]